MVNGEERFGSGILVGILVYMTVRGAAADIMFLEAFLRAYSSPPGMMRRLVALFFSRRA